MANYGNKFHWADYLLFAISFAVTLGVGFFFAIKDKWHKQSSESYLMANRQMNYFLVAMSFLATAMSALLFVGITAEFYYMGINFAWVGIAYLIGAAFTAIIVIPKFYRVGFEITSAYEYFERRFNLPVRMVVGVAYVLGQLLYMAVSLYIPSLVLSQVSVLSIYWSITLGAGVCLVYTAFGGMKAVIWVDNIQLLIIAIGMATLAAKGIIDAGGMDKVWEVYSTIGERNNWKDTSTDPWNRHTIWNVVFLLGINLAGAFSTPQSLLQRYMTVPSMKKSQLSILIGILVSLPFLMLVCIIAMAAFAVVGGNEPLLTGDMDAADQIMPFFLMYLLGDLHGIPGLVVAALFAAALSTLSSGQNALAAVLLEDFIRPIHKLKTGNNLTEKASGITSRVLGVVMGILILLISLAVPSFSDTLLTMALSIQSFVSGPLLGLLIVAFFFFWVESWGALVGLISSIAWAIFMYFGSKEYGNKLGQDQPPLFLANYTKAIRFPEPTAEPTLFDVSYTWYVFLDVMILIIVSTIVSLIVHGCRHGRLRKSDMMPPKELRYTWDDFVIAFGCRKDEQVKPPPMDVDQLPMTEKPGVYLPDGSSPIPDKALGHPVSPGEVNPAFTGPYISNHDPYPAYKGAYINKQGPYTGPEGSYVISNRSSLPPASTAPPYHSDSGPYVTSVRI